MGSLSLTELHVLAGFAIAGAVYIVLKALVMNRMFDRIDAYFERRRGRG